MGLEAAEEDRGGEASTLAIVDVNGEMSRWRPTRTDLADSSRPRRRCRGCRLVRRSAGCALGYAESGPLACIGACSSLSYFRVLGRRVYASIVSRRGRRR